MLALVVGGDGDIDKLEGGISIAQGNNGNVDVRSFTDSLVVDTGVGNDDEAGLLERACDVVGEATGGETTSDGLSTGVGSEFEDGTLAVWASRNDTNVVGVLNSCDYTGGEDELFPSFSYVNDMDTC